MASWFHYRPVSKQAPAHKPAHAKLQRVLSPSQKSVGQA